MSLKGRNRKTLLTAIRAAVKAEKGATLTYAKFIRTSKLRPQDIFRHFAKWNDALRAAGYKFERFNAPVTSTQLLEDWARIARRHKRIPTHLEYNLHGNHSITTFFKRFGAWSKVPEAFRAFARRSPAASRKWKDVRALLPAVRKSAPQPSSGSKQSTRPLKLHSSAPVTHRPRRAARLPGRPVCGAPLDFAGLPLDFVALRYAPANELGVVFLFGAMAKELGFLVESFQVEFPDCEAKRLIAPGTYQTVRIEFEYESRNFRDHGHDPAACDLIVCYRNNWPECPVEVIALSEELKRIPRDITKHAFVTE